jgi:hypothetical protein
MTTIRSLEFPDFDSFEKETGQEDGLEFARHKCYQSNNLVVEMTYFFKYMDYIPNKWPCKVVVIDYTDSLKEEVTKE